MVLSQGGLETSEKMALPLQAFCDHVSETSWSQWTYVQDELFLPMRQFLRQEVGTSVSHVFFSFTTSSLDVLGPPVAFNAVFITVNRLIFASSYYSNS